MPKRISETPPWLSRPSSGARIFSDPKTQAPQSPSKRISKLAPQSTDYYGPRRLIAKRGTEIFVAIENKIRWADLARTTAQWDQDPDNRDDRPLYRELGVSVYYTIRQLIISPSGNFLAICTDYTVQIAVLPDHSRLSEQEQSTLKLTTHQLGPTCHVMPGSPLASVLWHPLANATTASDCLVTVTAEAAMRLWTLERSNKQTFQEPELAIDLRKLADGVSSDQDFQPSRFGTNKGFSVDDFDMEVASACFGGSATGEEDAWASMTLWVAMKNGDLYALCPLLPPQWRPTSTTVPSLATSAVSRMATVDGADITPDARRAADQQYEWVSEIDADDHLADDADLPTDVRLRPINPSAIPRLQGPFELGLQDDVDVEITDILVLPSRLDQDDLYSGEDDYSNEDSSGLPYTVIILGGSDSRVHIALDLEGVSGQWLPRKGRNTFSMPVAETRELTVLTTIIVGEAASSGSTASALAFVSFTPDAVLPHTVFASVEDRIISISLDEWVSRIGVEMSPEAEANDRLKTRLETTCRNEVAIVDNIVECKDRSTEPLSAPVVVDDPDVGYLVLSYASTTAYAARLDQSHRHALSLRQSMSFLPGHSQLPHFPQVDDRDSAAFATVPVSRAVYSPSRLFDENPSIPIDTLRHRLPHSQKRILTEQPMRLSPALLDVMSSAHRTISSQTAKLETAATELFRRCERLREELGEQVKQMSELADKLHKLQDSGDEDLRPGEERLTQDRRLERAREKQLGLDKRFDDLRRKVAKVGSGRRELSQKEKAWIEEVSGIGMKVGVGVDGADGDSRARESLESRVQTVSFNLDHYEIDTMLT
jgi:nucleoporin NUP82